MAILSETDLDKLEKDNAWNNGDDGLDSDGIAMTNSKWNSVRETIRELRRRSALHPEDLGE